MGEICGKNEYNKKPINNIKPILISIKDIPQIIELFISFWGTKNLYTTSYLKLIICQNISYGYKIKDELIACCLMAYNYKKNFVTVILLCVKKEYQGKYLGKSLLSFCINICRYGNVRNFDLNVSVANKKAFNLYRKLGFVVKNYIPNYYNDENPKDNDSYYMILKI